VNHAGVGSTGIACVEKWSVSINADINSRKHIVNVLHSTIKRTISFCHKTRKDSAVRLFTRTAQA